MRHVYFLLVGDKDDDAIVGVLILFMSSVTSSKRMHDMSGCLCVPIMSLKGNVRSVTGPECKNRCCLGEECDDPSEKE
jgi:hypothetical protein